MTRKEGIQRFLLIVKALRRRRCSFVEIQSAITREQPTIIYSQRTLQRDIHDLAELYNIYIKCDGQNLYYIEDDYSDQCQQALDLLDAFNIFQTINKQKEFNEYIEREPICPKGSELLDPLLSACKNRQVIHIDYKSPWSKETSRKVHPYGIKEFERRWYLIAFDPAKNEFRTFGLERIIKLDVLYGEQFNRKESFCLKDHFKDCYGIIKPSAKENLKVETVLLSVDKGYSTYLINQPLHASQRVVEVNGDEVVIELTLFPSWDFQQKLLSIGDKVFVISPESLRNEMIKTLKYNLGWYG